MNRTCKQKLRHRQQYDGKQRRSGVGEVVKGKEGPLYHDGRLNFGW